MRTFKFLLVAFLAGILSACFAPPQPDAGRESEAEKLVEQGTGYLRRAQFDEARASFQVAFEIGGTAPALDGLGCVALLEGNYVRAESYFLKALELDPSYRTPLANLGVLYDLLGKRKEALKLYEAALRSNPSNPRIRNNIAAALFDEASSRKAEARALQELRKAAALAPHPVIMSNLESMRNQ
jgi:Flp pilus assembly protein TadD